MRISEFEKLSPRQRAAYERSLEALTRMRKEGESLKVAASKAHVDPRTVQKYAGSALRLDTRTGEWKARKHDNLLREVEYVTPGGKQKTVLVRGSREAEKVAQWQSAVLLFQRDGNPDYLRRLRHKTFVDAEGKRRRLATNPREIDRWTATGQINIEEVQTP